MRRFRISLLRTLATLVPLAIAIACGSSDDSTFQDGSSGGFGNGGDGGSSGLGDGGGIGTGCGNGPPCAQGMVCDENTNECIPGGSCGAEEATGTSTPPNMLVVLDRSCSMTGKVGAQTKWEIAVDALKTLTTQNNGKIRFGLELFPDKVGNECTQGPIEIPVGPNNEQKIENLLTKALVKGDPFFPEGPCVTNIDTAMEAAAKEPAWSDKTRGNFAVLLTDGKQAGCNAAGGDDGTKKILEDMLAKQIPTFVIGFGAEIDPAQMNVFAVAGGAPRNDPTTKYYKAEDKASLAAALATIAKKTLSCVFTLSKTPPDPAKIFAFFDNKTTVPRDPTKTNGWEYDPATNTVTFYGAVCDELRLAKVTDVDIVFGCPEATPR